MAKSENIYANTTIAIDKESKVLLDRYSAIVEKERKVDRIEGKMFTGDYIMDAVHKALELRYKERGELMQDEKFSKLIETVKLQMKDKKDSEHVIASLEIDEMLKRKLVKMFINLTI